MTSDRERGKRFRDAGGRECSAVGWREVHAVFKRHGLEFKPYRRVARIGDLVTPQTVNTLEFDLTLTLGAMAERFGPYKSSQQARLSCGEVREEAALQELSFCFSDRRH